MSNKVTETKFNLEDAASKVYAKAEEIYKGSEINSDTLSSVVDKYFSKKYSPRQLQTIKDYFEEQELIFDDIYKEESKKVTEAKEYTIVSKDDLDYIGYRDEFDKYVLESMDDEFPYVSAGSKKAVMNMLQHMVEEWTQDNLIPIIEEVKNMSEPFVIFTCEDNCENPKVEGISLETFYNDYVKNFKSSNYRNPDGDDENRDDYINWFKREYNINESKKITEADNLVTLDDISDKATELGYNTMYDDRDGEGKTILVYRNNSNKNFDSQDNTELYNYLANIPNVRYVTDDEDTTCLAIWLKDLNGNQKVTEANELGITGLSSEAKNIADTFTNYKAYVGNFEPLKIVKQGKYYLIFKEDAKNYNDYIQECPSKDYVEGWLYGAVQCKNKIMESKKVTEGKLKILPNSELPELCYTYVASDNVIGVIKKDVEGYYPSNIEITDDMTQEDIQRIVDDNNELLEVTPDQAFTMKFKSLHGWNDNTVENKKVESVEDNLKYTYTPEQIREALLEDNKYYDAEVEEDYIDELLDKVEKIKSEVPLTRVTPVGGDEYTAFKGRGKVVTYLKDGRKFVAEEEDLALITAIELVVSTEIKAEFKNMDKITEEKVGDVLTKIKDSINKLMGDKLKAEVGQDDEVAGLKLTRKVKGDLVTLFDNIVKNLQKAGFDRSEYEIELIGDDLYLAMKNEEM